MTSQLALLAPSLLLAGAAVAGPALHVAPTGDDTAAGTAEAPVRSLAALQRILADRRDVTEVVLHAGVYRESLSIAPPRGLSAEETAKLPPLLVRAAEGEAAVLDGARRIAQSEPVAGSPGVFRVAAEPYLSEANRERGRMPGMWDAEARQRYQLVADPAAVASFPSSYCFTGGLLYLSTSDGRDPAHHQVELSSLTVGTAAVLVARPNVTVRGLAARNFHGDYTSSPGFYATADHVTIEDCRTDNCPRGFRATGRNVRFLRCRAEDCGGGVLINSKGALVEDCVFVRRRDAFMVPMPLQEDTGIEIYHPAGDDIVVRGNVAVGYTFCGVFIKCSPGLFRIERNTLAGNGTGLGWSPSPGKKILFERNLVYGGGRGVDGQTEDQELVNLSASGNVLWPGPFRDPRPWAENVGYLNGLGRDNVLADPRLVDPDGGDFRPAPGSPCLAPPVGALPGLPAGTPDRWLPRLSLDEQPDLAPLGADSSGRPLFATGQAAIVLRVRAADSISRPATASLRIDGGAWGPPRPYAKSLPVALPEQPGVRELAARVADEAGNWSEPAVIAVRVGVIRPALVGPPVVRANPHGLVISFETETDCRAFGEFGPDAAGGVPLVVHGPGGPSRRHVLSALRPADRRSDQWHYRVRLESPTGEPLELTGQVALTGPARRYVVAPDGTDAEVGGTADRPWRTCQYAADRALPGDTVVFRPGLYAERTEILRGGVAEAPLVIAAEEPGRTVLDGHRRVPELIRIADAPHVRIEGLELRWYGDPYGAAVRVDRSPEVTVRGCRIWNAFWHEGRATGTALVVRDSPGFGLERNVLFRNDVTFSLSRSPRSRIVHNTVRGHVHGGLTFDESVAGTVCRNNCLTYNGNYTYVIYVADPEELKTFDSDYNNLGGHIRDWRDEPGVAPNLPRARGAGKRLVYYSRKGGTWLLPTWPAKTYPPAQELAIRLKTDPRDPRWEGQGELMRIWLPDATTPPAQRGTPHWGPATIEDWQRFSGLDRHSIFADPKHVDPMAFDFRLSLDSPNRGAGEHGADLGALPTAP